jgi:phosphoglucomutase
MSMDQVQAVVTPTTPFEDQRPGTSGLRKKTRVFLTPGYLENFIQSVFDAIGEEVLGGFAGRTLVVGGDGRYFNRQASQTIIKMAAANGFERILVGRSGLLSTPAMSAVIRRRGTLGGLLLTASHNPGGIDADFGVKYNMQNGGPAPERITERIYAKTRQISRYLTLPVPDIDLDHEGTFSIGSTEICVIDPMTDYTAVMEEIFDFAALSALFGKGLRIVIDAMHGVTGPYAKHILESRLGAPAGTVIHGEPLEDFGGHHPDPNLSHATELVERMMGAQAPDFGAAFDGDGDRNMILAPGLFVTPGDSVAIIAEHARTCIPGYRQGLAGVARSMPTSTALDRVARSFSIPCFETPTGWKYFGNLMDAGMCTICGEESFGTGSDHVREKDGLWAVLSWLSILAATGKTAVQVVHDHWARFGRSYYQRRDFENLPAGPASAMLDSLRARLTEIQGLEVCGSAIGRADDFEYTDPVDGSITRKQGVRIFLADGSRIVCRFSGTGTEGMTLRLYLERFRADGSEPFDELINPLAEAALEIIRIKEFCGRDQADVIT